MALATSNKGTQLFIIQICCLTLVWVTAALRLWVRLMVTKTQALDDWLMYLSVLFYTSLAVFVFRGTIDGGIGKHTDGLSVHETVVGMQAWYFGELIYGALSILVRTSVVLFLLRVCRSSVHRRIFYVCLATVCATSTVYFFASLFQCSPPPYYWEQFSETDKKGACLSSRVMTTTAIVLSAVAGVSDWVIALMPVVILWDVQIPRRSKSIIVGLMSVGVVAGVVIIIRIPYIKGLEITKEFLHETVDVAIWTVIEPSLGIAAGCLATVRPLFATRRPPPPTPVSNSEFWTGTTATANGGWRGSTDYPPPSHGIGVVRKFVCTNQPKLADDKIDYHRFVRDIG